MAGKRKTLGRGLDALLGTGPRDNKEPAEGGDLRFLAIDLLQRGQYQPRHDMRPESLQDLADSIRAQGVVQPIVVRPLAPQAGQPRRYEIIAGERRWRAAQLAGLQEMPAVVRHVSDSAAVAMALIENIQRENLNPLEEAAALTRLITEFDMTHQQAAEAVGRSRAAVSNLLRLLELAEDVKILMQERKLEMGHARALLGLPTARQQVEVATVVTKRGLSVRETEAMVRGLLKPKSGKPAKPAADPDIRALEGELGDKLGARVQIQSSAGGKGKLVIAYNSLDELEGILGHIR
ncbi:MAG: ParB/RepB/Spo0J family partition protein [Gammaproteobacteria bacterium]|nr:ParB/RepB/Spo0J family partition protein [Gammaproteobacteria bacterium]